MGDTAEDYYPRTVAGVVSKLGRRWARSERGWNRVVDFGGTDFNLALTWYQYAHKPGSKEWRPKVIVCAICGAAGVEGAVLP